MQQVFDQLHHQRSGARMVHEAQATAAVRLPDGAGGCLQDVAESATTVRGLLGSWRDWQAAHGVTHLAMGSHWRVLAAGVGDP